MHRPHLVEQLAREALSEDPDLAMAQVLVAHALMRQGKRTPALAAAEQAVAMAAQGSEIERLIAGAELDSLRAGLAFGSERLTLRRASVAAFEASLALESRHDWALRSLSGLDPELGRHEDALSVAERLATLHPLSLTALWRAALAADCLGDTARARRYADRGNRLDEAVDERNAYQAGWMRLFPARQAWIEGDVATASLVVARAMREMERLTPAAQEGFAVELVQQLLALGQLARAELNNPPGPGGAQLLQEPYRHCNAGPRHDRRRSRSRPGEDRGLLPRCAAGDPHHLRVTYWSAIWAVPAMRWACSRPARPGHPITCDSRGRSWRRPTTAPTG